MKHHHSIILACFMLLLVLLASASISPEIQVIVQADTMELAAAVVEEHGGRVGERLSIINSVAADVSPGAVDALRADSRVAAVFVDHEVDAAGSRIEPPPSVIASSPEPRPTLTTAPPLLPAGAP